MSKSIDDLDVDIDHLRDRLDTLEERTSEAQTPWYKNTSAAVAVIASIVSVLSGVTSYFHTNAQDTQSRRSELRGILQRLVALPKEQVEASISYKSEPQIQMALSGFQNQENIMLAQQADSIARRLPDDQVSSIDYMTIGMALENSRQFPAALVDLQKAVDKSSELDDSVGALRYLGTLQMSMGRQDDARKTFQRAVDIFKIYPNFDDFTRGWMTVQTELAWANAEVLTQNFVEASKLIADADINTKKFPNGVVASYWRDQVSLYKQQLTLFTTRPPTTARDMLGPLVPTTGTVATTSMSAH